MQKIVTEETHIISKNMIIHIVGFECLHTYQNYSMLILVNTIIEMGDSVKIPDGLPQPKNIYLDQIEILKPILKSKAKKSPEKLTSVLEKTKSSTGTKLKSSNKELQKCSEKIKTIDLTHSPGPSKEYNSKAHNLNQESMTDKIAKPDTMLYKLQKNAPYNLFFTTVIKSPESGKQPNAITFSGR